MDDLPPIPESAKPPPGAYVLETMNDFEWGDSLVFPRGKAPEMPNITQIGPRTFNFWLRHRGDPKKDPEAWYDGDRDLQWNEGKRSSGYKDKSRVELLMGNQKYGMGETWLIGSTIRLNPDFVPFRGYCNIMQPVGLQSWLSLDSIKGDIVTGTLVVGSPSKRSRPTYKVRTFTMKRGEWTTFVVRIRVAKDGEYGLSVNGDPFKTARMDTTVSDKDKPPFDGTWGLYGSGTYDVNKRPLRDSIIQHTNIWVKKSNGNDYTPIPHRSAAIPATNVSSRPAAVAPRIPSWVRGDPFLDKREKVVNAAKRNASIVEQANKSGARYDFVLYGDSITQRVGDKYMDVWKEHFGHLGRSAPLGVGGNTVEELSFRLSKGREKFAIGPRVVAVLIGVNNLRSAENDPAPLLGEFLVPYIRAVWPDTTLLLLGILPVESHDVRPYNAKYEQIARKHGAVYLSCGDDIDPRNKRDMPDGVHPGPSGYKKLFSCLRRAVDKAITAGA
jgi:lysophospholipase L1-like esterase